MKQVSPQFYQSVSKYLQLNKPDMPTYCIRLQSCITAAKYFMDNLQGRILYAVKANPHPLILRALINTGIDAFDVASLAEIKLINSISSKAEMYFMHPVKSEASIKEAYFAFNIKNYALDCFDELDKILSSTQNANDLNLFVRISIPNSFSEMDLSGKFGSPIDEVVELLKVTRTKAKKLGICFHVGSQSMHPEAYKCALEILKKLLVESGEELDSIDIGGGFPSIYPGLNAPPLQAFFDEIHQSLKRLNLSHVALLAEPGRALVAESGSVIVKVLLRKNNLLYINDGTYGSLFDACRPKFVFPARVFSNGQQLIDQLSPFSFYGPTCDSLDFMEGPFFLPSSLKNGDYIEIGQLGAYGISMRTHFNGFYSDEFILVGDEPLLSMYAFKEEDTYECLNFA